MGSIPTLCETRVYMSVLDMRVKREHVCIILKWCFFALAIASYEHLWEIDSGGMSTPDKSSFTLQRQRHNVHYYRVIKCWHYNGHCGNALRCSNDNWISKIKKLPLPAHCEQGLNVKERVKRILIVYKRFFRVKDKTLASTFLKRGCFHFRFHLRIYWW